jgi:hypothetical protein
MRRACTSQADDADALRFPADAVVESALKSEDAGYFEEAWTHRLPRVRWAMTLQRSHPELPTRLIVLR